jgi:two-component system response regulator EvgA
MSNHALPTPKDRPIRTVLADSSHQFLAATARFLATIPELSLVGQADNGIELLRLAETLTPDLVLMELCMPGVDGIGTIRTLKALNPAPKIIALIYYADLTLQAASLRAGAHDHLGKTAVTELLPSLLCQMFPDR